VRCPALPCISPGIPPADFVSQARSRGLQPAFPVEQTVGLKSERGLKPATTCSIAKCTRSGKKCELATFFALRCAVLYSHRRAA